MGSRVKKMSSVQILHSPTVMSPENGPRRVSCCACTLWQCTEAAASLQALHAIHDRTA